MKWVSNYWFLCQVFLEHLSFSNLNISQQYFAKTISNINKMKIDILAVHRFTKTRIPNKMRVRTP